MFRIAICDDNKAHRREISDVVSTVLFDIEELEIFVDLFADGSQLLELIDSNLFDYDLLLLDIMMPMVNGFEVARAIRESHLPTEIIFITEHEEYVFEGYSFRAFSYLVKPVTVEKVSRELKRFINERKSDSKSFLLLSGNGITQLFDVRRIEYIESIKRKVNVMTDRGGYEFYAKLDDLEQQVSPNLFRTHQSYMVNLRKTAEIRKTSLTLCSGAVIPISKKYAAEFVQAIYEISDRSVFA